MCGVAGIIGDPAEGSDITVAVRRMVNAIEHRGPDGQGVESVSIGGSKVCFGHARLAILELSPAGFQPMGLEGTDELLVFNGEIYNHLEIRNSFLSGLGITWRGHSDTETLLNCLHFLGFEKTLALIRGMFAFAWLNPKENKVYLARDRIGEKPLYYGSHDGDAFFCSELKGLKASNFFPLKLSRNAIFEYLEHHFVPAPLSIYRGVFKLPPASWAVFDLADRVWGKPITYWTPVSERKDRDGANQASLLAHMKSAVSEQLVADVPVGCFLSGGYDSSLVCALAQEVSNQTIKTFSIGFQDDAHNEAHFAADVAKYLGTDHHELYITDENALALVPELPGIWDEPFADSSQLPTLLLSRFAKENVSVCLSGDGGDELFAGYQRHKVFQKLWPLVSSLPDSLLAAGSILAGASGRAGQRVAPNVSKRLIRLAPFLDKKGGAPAFYRKFLCAEEAGLQKNGVGGHLWYEDLASCPSTRGALGLAQWLDQRCYLPDDILVKVDRASMSCSLETRIPLLDYRIVEDSWSFSQRALINEKRGSKALLKDIAHMYLPQEMMERPKHGFSIPMHSWLSGVLREWAESMLKNLALFPETQSINYRDAWMGFLAGKTSLGPAVWGLIMLGAWLAHNKPENGSSVR